MPAVGRPWPSDDDDDDWGEFGGDGDRSFGQEMSQFGPTITSTNSSSLFGIVLPSHYQSLTGPHSLAFKALPFKQFLPTTIVHTVLKMSKLISWHGTHCKSYTTSTVCMYIVQCTLCMCTGQCEPGQRWLLYSILVLWLGCQLCVHLKMENWVSIVYCSWRGLREQGCLLYYTMDIEGKGDYCVYYVCAP